MLPSPALCSWAPRSLTRGGSGGGSLLWVLVFTGLHPLLPFSLTCLLLLTTPILSESTQQISAVHKRTPKPFPGADFKGREAVVGRVEVKVRTRVQKGFGRAKLVCIFFQEPEEVAQRGRTPGSRTQRRSGLRKVPETCWGGSQALGAGALPSRKR